MVNKEDVRGLVLRSLHAPDGLGHAGISVIMSYFTHNAKPADSGWTYKGSNAQSRVEYWAKDGCKMDYYPTTGIVHLLQNMLSCIALTFRAK